MKHWPHQAYAIREIVKEICEGRRRMCLTSPTGGGKSRIILDVARWLASQNLKGVLYTNRRILTDQMIGHFETAGMDFGVRASGYDKHLMLWSPFQISSVQTENTRVFGEKPTWESLHPATVVMVDEAHNEKGDTLKRILREHYRTGAILIGVTATPIALAPIYDHLIVAGQTSELRDCGALLPCTVYAPDEFDTSKVKQQQTGEFSYKDIKKKVWTPQIFGRVLDHYRKFNPEGRPAILFAPGRAESQWFAEELTKAGVEAAHIDGNEVWWNGRRYPSSAKVRRQVIDRVRCGDTKILCNRFVCREGVDIPELYHGILATPIGSFQSYKQVVGRILRNHPSMDSVCLQDHGGNFWRHGSPNEDVDWVDYFESTESKRAAIRQEDFREGRKQEPIRCPNCDMVRAAGMACPACGHCTDRRTRVVLQHDGSLKEVHGRVYTPRYRERKTNTQTIWQNTYFRMKRAKRTFRQAEALFLLENGYWPPRDLPLMPVNAADWPSKISDVPTSRLQTGA